jgi:hypothetical protein
VHDPGKVGADLAAAVALGGDCLADIAVLREQPGLAGPVASDPVVSRLVSVLAADVPRFLKAGAVGAVMPTALIRITALPCHFRMPARCRRRLRHRGLPRRPGWRGPRRCAGRRFGLPVDAVGVDLEQDCDAVPGTAGDFGGGHAGVEP